MNLGTFDFWQRWLFVACLGAIGLGLSLAIFDIQLLPGFASAVAMSLWDTPTMPEEVVTYHRYVHAVLGATVASWGALLAFVAHHAFRAKQAWAWWCFVTALGVWYPLDTTASLYYGVWANALLNTGALILLAPPLVFTRRAFAPDASG